MKAKDIQENWQFLKEITENISANYPRAEELEEVWLHCFLLAYEVAQSLETRSE